MQQLELVRGHYAHMKLVANQLLGKIDDRKLRPPTDYIEDGLRSSRTPKFCRAHHLPLGADEPKHGVTQTVHSFEHRRRH